VLKVPLNPNQPTNQPTYLTRQFVCFVMFVLSTNSSVLSLWLCRCPTQLSNSLQTNLCKILSGIFYRSHVLPPVTDTLKTLKVICNIYTCVSLHFLFGTSLILYSCKTFSERPLDTNEFDFVSAFLLLLYITCCLSHSGV